jgi:hypothetical protein
MDNRRSTHIAVLELAQMKLVEGARNLEPVTGLTHNFYRYPARFSPAFARAVIEAFTEPGDFVLDPYMGGGTSLVEAAALGRSAVGVDISQLAEFIASVKTTVMSDSELQRLSQWAVKLSKHIHIHHPARRFAEYAERGYYKHLDHTSRWRLRKAIDQALRSALRLGVPQTEAFARCVVLRTAQWALDGRKSLPSVAEFRDALSENAVEMTAAAREFRDAIQSHSNLPSVHILNRSTVGLDKDHRIAFFPAPKLVVTSPPYPGVHILYHRWQIDGGKEAPLPFMIANKLDGAGSSYYTMGDRKTHCASLACMCVEKASSLEPARIVPGQGIRIRAMTCRLRNKDLLTVKTVVVPTVFKFFPNASAHLKVQVGRHRYIARIK